MSSHLTAFNACSKSLKAKLLQQGYRYHILRKAFSKLYRRHFELVPKYKVNRKAIPDYGHFCNKAFRNLNIIVT